MALHPQAKAFLDLMASFNAPDISEAGAFAARSGSHGEPDISGPLDPTVRIDNRFFTSSTADTYIKIYTPAGSGPFNALVYFHGGGWVVNYVGKYDAQCAALATMTNSVVISINYQKAPEHKFPIPFNDCYEGLEWTVANADRLGIDLDRLGVGGDSAGGNLASAVALKARDENIELAYQLLLYPCNQKDRDTESMNDYAEGYGLTRDRMTFLWDQYLNGNADDNNPYAVPHSATTLKGLAPAIVILAQCDVLYSDGKKYAQRLTDEEVSVSLREYPGMLHGFFSLGAFLTDSLRLREEISEEINKILGL